MMRGPAGAAILLVFVVTHPLSMTSTRNAR